MAKVGTADPGSGEGRPPVPPSRFRCPTCRFGVVAGANFCWRCGTPLREGLAEPERPRPTPARGRRTSARLVVSLVAFALLVTTILAVTRSREADRARAVIAAQEEELTRLRRGESAAVERLRARVQELEDMLAASGDAVTRCAAAAEQARALDRALGAVLRAVDRLDGSAYAEARAGAVTASRRAAPVIAACLAETGAG